MEPPEEIPDESYGVAAFHLLAHSWKTTEHSTDPAENKRSINKAASELWQVVIDSDDPEEAVYCSVRALHTFACKATPALEHSLDIIAQAFTDLPEPTEFPAGKGAEGAFDILAWWFIEWSGRFKGPAYSTPSEQSRHCKVDASHTHDSTNIYPDLSDTPIEEISRLEFIVAMAIQARCHVKGISYLNCPETVIPLIQCCGAVYVRSSAYLG